jgi:hypothetical protein
MPLSDSAKALAIDRMVEAHDLNKVHRNSLITVRFTSDEITVRVQNSHPDWKSEEGFTLEEIAMSRLNPLTQFVERSMAEWANLKAML